jgi:hypothetical protein
MSFSFTTLCLQAPWLHYIFRIYCASFLQSIQWKIAQYFDTRRTLQNSLYCTSIMSERTQDCASVMALMKRVFVLKRIFKLSVNNWPLKHFLYEIINLSVSQSFRNSLSYYPPGLLTKYLFTPSADSLISTTEWNGLRNNPKFLSIYYPVSHSNISKFGWCLGLIISHLVCTRWLNTPWITL